MNILVAVGKRLAVLLLRPVMLVAHAQFDSAVSAGLTPTDSPQGYGRGLDPDRILLLGSKEVTGSGVVSHQLALVGGLANEVSQATGRGTDVDLSVPSYRGIREASRSVPMDALQKYDAVVVALGESDAFSLTHPEDWAFEMDSLLETLRVGSAPGTPIVVSGIPQIALGGPLSKLVQRAQKHAERLNGVTEFLCTRWSNATFVRVPSPIDPGSRSTPAVYTQRGHSIARQLAPRLGARGLTYSSGAGSPRINRSLPQSRIGRRRALLDLGVSLTGPDVDIYRVVNMAKTYFRTDHAALVLSDGDNIGIRSTAGTPGNLNLAELASPTIETGRPTLIGCTIPVSTNTISLHVHEAGVGFYAGYPIESPDGYRIGVLSVFDPAPRPARAYDIVALRDLAMMLQRELWAPSVGKDNRG